MWNQLGFNARFILILAGILAVYGFAIASPRTVEDLLVLGSLALIPASVVVAWRNGAVRGLGLTAAVLAPVAVLHSDETSVCLALWLIAAFCVGLVLGMRSGLRHVRSGRGWAANRRDDSGLVGIAVKGGALEVRATDVLAQLGLDDGSDE